MTSHPRANELGPATRAIHHGYDPARHEGALIPPVFMTSTYAFEDAAGMAAVVTGDAPGQLYGREFNPTQRVLEHRLANLEGAEAGVVFASGMAAVGAMLLSLLSHGDELVVHRTLYSNTYSLVHDALPRFGIKAVPVDLTDPANLDAALSAKTKLVYFESPVNPISEVIDIAAVARRAKAAGIPVAVDSTFASPALQRPIEHGADLVLHSLTKYLNGHGDMLGGAIVGSHAHVDLIRDKGLRYITGATLAPLSAYFVLRGLKTLHLRMERHGETALAIAEMLAAHPKIRAVRYPFLPSDRGYAVARGQMRNGSGMMSFEHVDGVEGGERMMDRLQVVSRAVSLGDAESLIMSPGSIAAARRRKSQAHRLAEGVSEALIRLSVGLEDARDLLADIDQALA